MRALLGSLIVLLGFGFHELIHWYPRVDWLNSPVFGILWPIMVVALGIGLILTAPLFNKRDPVLFGWLAFSLCGCLLVLPLLLAKTAQERLDEAAAANLIRLQEDVQAEIRRKAQAALEKARAGRASEKKDRFTQYVGRIDILSLEKIRSLDLKMEAALKERSDAYKAALETYPTRGPDAWITASTREELQEERVAHQKIYEAARGFTQFVEGFEDAYTEEVEQLDLKPPADRVAIAEMQRILQFAEANKVYELRKLDVEAIGAALAALNVLYEEWGNWSFDRRQQALSFEDPAREAAFQQALQRFVQASEAVQAITKPPETQN